MLDSSQPQTDTIVALSTPHGKGAIAIIRLSGPQALSIVQSFWQGKKPLKDLEPRTLVGGWVVIDDHRLDSSLVATSHAPRSYTGEDMVEVHTHGAPAIIQAVLNTAHLAGARLAEPGEFTRRALLGNKLDVTQAEAVADLVEAESTKLVRLAADQLAGGLSNTILALVEKIVSIAAQEAAYLDFSEEDIASEDSGVLSQNIKECQSELQKMLDYAVNIPLLRDGVTIALIGLPNAGKSTLLNTLVGFERSIVTDIVGTTRDTIDERIMLGDVAVRLIDTAGLNTHPDAVEAIGIERTHRAVAQADIVMILISPGQLGVTEEYLNVQKLSGLLRPQKTICVFTKADLGPPDIQSVDWAHQSCSISATTGAGIAELKSLLTQYVPVESSDQTAVLTTQRQVELVRGAKHRLDQALTLVEDNEPRDIVLVELEAAAKELTRISGTDSNDAMLDDMFSRFCIGK